MISSTMRTAKMRWHYWFLPFKVSCILLALVIYKMTCYLHHESNSVSRRHQSIHLSIWHIRPSYCYTIVSQSQISRQTLSCALVAINYVGGFGNSWKPKNSCDEEVRHLRAFLNEWRVNLWNLDYISCLTKSMFDITLAPPKAGSFQHILLEQRRSWSAGQHCRRLSHLGVLDSTSARFGVCSEARRYSISYSQNICTTEFFKAKMRGNYSMSIARNTLMGNLSKICNQRKKDYDSLLRRMYSSTSDGSA